MQFDCAAMFFALDCGRLVPHMKLNCVARPQGLSDNPPKSERGSPYIAMADSWRGGARDDPHFGQAHMGPIPLRGGGTLTAADRQVIMTNTGCSASVRYRPQWQERCLTITGPAEWLTRAKDMAVDLIKKNGEDGGRTADPCAGPTRSEFQALQTTLQNDEPPQPAGVGVCPGPVKQLD